jgi:hypothetical protein
MYGLGVYLADLAQKSHRYVREPEVMAPSPQAAPRYQWQTVLAGKWRPFDVELQEEFEEASQAGLSIYNFSARGWSYNLDFKNMLQANLSTGRERAVRRVDADSIDMTASLAEVCHHPSGQKIFSMIRCRVVLGTPYLIEGNLLKADGMHNMCWCQDPSDVLETCAESWSVAKGHDAFYVRGLAGVQKAGLGVYNSEYIVFQPYQILPLYQVDYVLE